MLVRLHQVPEAGFGIRDSGIGDRGSGIGIRDSGFGIGDWRISTVMVLNRSNERRVSWPIRKRHALRFGNS
jgi:hypothetical protein